MTSETMTTTLGAVLTHTTGCLLATIDDAWPLQDFITGVPLMTHMRTRDEYDITSRLLQQFPKLAEASPPKISTQAEAEAWVASVSAYTGYPLSVEVTR